MTPVLRLLQNHSQGPAAFEIVQVLHGAGHRVLFAGGCVRDALLGRPAQDLDIATSATPDQISALFQRTVDVGKSFGVVRVLVNQQDLEVATFRRDGEYKDGRHPEGVAFSDEREDALRRDFTVNALFFDAAKEEILDYVGGREDLKAGKLRTVGEAHQRFTEDHLRILRAVRFAVQLGFSIEEQTWQEVRRMAVKAGEVSRERIRDEMVKLLKTGAGQLGPRLLRDSGLADVLFPSLHAHQENLLAGAKAYLGEASGSAEEALARWLAPLGIATSIHWPDVKATIESLRLSKSQYRFLEKAFDVWMHGERFWQQTPGRQILEYSEPGVPFALNLRDRVHPDPRHEELKKLWRQGAPQGVLPARWVTGSDLQSVLKGPELGKWLETLYEGQLEGRFHDKSAASTWLRGHLKLEP